MQTYGDIKRRSLRHWPLSELFTYPGACPSVASRDAKGKIEMRLVLMVAIATFCASLFTSEAAAQTRYPLHCRAGGDMSVNVLGQEAGGGTEVVVSFRRSTATRALSPGQCTWLDRVVNTREPTSFRIIFRARTSVDFRPRAGDHAGDRADAFVMTGPDADLARTFFSTLEAGGSFQVQAYNPGRAPMNAIDFRVVPAR